MEMKFSKYGWMNINIAQCCRKLKQLLSLWNPSKKKQGDQNDAGWRMQDEIAEF